jgi:hypothetical protein
MVYDRLPIGLQQWVDEEHGDFRILHDEGEWMALFIRSDGATFPPVHLHQNGAIGLLSAAALEVWATGKIGLNSLQTDKSRL